MEKPAKRSTQQVSFDMFNEGLDIAEIAARRHLSPGTIEGHLTAFIASGDLDITRVVPQHKLDQVLATIKTTGQTFASKPIRDILGDEYTYGEIRMCLAHYKRLNG